MKTQTKPTTKTNTTPVVENDQTPKLSQESSTCLRRLSHLFYEFLKHSHGMWSRTRKYQLEHDARNISASASAMFIQTCKLLGNDYFFIPVDDEDATRYADQVAEEQARLYERCLIRAIEMWRSLKIPFTSWQVQSTASSLYIQQSVISNRLPYSSPEPME